MRLKTIGGLWIEGEAAPALGPRPLALLALLAAAGKQGVSRERVIGVLWSETGEDQARHTLSQTLYSLRRETGRDLIAGTTSLRLDPILSSDIGELKDAAVSADYETVERLYQGMFLEGFYLPGAPEFERWVEEERAALHREALRSVERLATTSSEPVRWWHRLTQLDPLSARYAAGHMQALAALGNISGALAAARLHTETVRRELDAEPDAAVRKLEQSLRASSPPLPATRSPLPDSPSPPSVPLPAPRSRLPLLGALAAVVMVVAVLTVLVLLPSSRRPVLPPSLPFLAVGEITAERDTSGSGRILRDLLATSLGAIDGLQVVANSRLVELMPRGPDPAPGAVKDAARRAGATELIEGELTREPAGFVLSLRRVSVDRGVVRKGYIVRARDAAGLADSATAALARDLRLAPPAVTAVQIRTASPVAYALFDEGLRAYYGYDAPAAYRLMKAALARDSSFAMAAYYVWHLSQLFYNGEGEERILPLVERLARHTIERERLLIQASLAESNGPIGQAVAIAETLTVKYPEDPDGQILLGQVRHKEGDWAGAVTALERAYALDSAAGALSGPYCRVCRTVAQMVLSYTWWDSAAAAERTSRRLIAVRPNEAGTWNNLIEVLLRLGRRAEAEAAWARQANPAGDWSGYQMHRDLIRWGRYEQADRELIAEIASPTVHIRADAWWLLLLSLRDQGRLREADTLIHRWRVPNTGIRVPEPGPEPVDYALLALEMGRPEVSVRAHRENAARMRTRSGPPAVRARNLAWQLALAGTAHAAAGDTAVVRRLADSLESLGAASSFGRDARLHYVLRGLLLQGEGRHAEAVEAFRRSLFSLTDGYTRTNLLLARSLLALGRGAEAVAVLRPAIHGGVDGGNTYVSRTELHEAMAEAFEQAGRPDSAAAHWRAVESAWRRADPQFRERYQRARLKAGT